MDGGEIRKSGERSANKSLTLLLKSPAPLDHHLAKVTVSSKKITLQTGWTSEVDQMNLKN